MSPTSSNDELDLHGYTVAEAIEQFVFHLSEHRSSATTGRTKVDWVKEKCRMKGLLIKERWLDLILSGKKTWEIRGKATTIRGSIALIQSGTGMVYGVCEILDVCGPLSIEEMQVNCHHHCIDRDEISRVVHYKQVYAWVLQGARLLRVPVRYNHPYGAVIWVNLSEQVNRQIKSES